LGADEVGEAEEPYPSQVVHLRWIVVTQIDQPRQFYELNKKGELLATPPQPAVPQQGVAPVPDPIDLFGMDELFGDDPTPQPVLDEVTKRLDAISAAFSQGEEGPDDSDLACDWLILFETDEEV
jgi:hypothetical protein